MRLHLHPTRREALTVSETTLTRWSLAGRFPSKLRQVSTAPHSLLDLIILQDGRLAISGGVTGASDGDLFALQSIDSQKQKPTDPCVIELRHWEDFSLAKTFTIAQAFGPLDSIDSSADGRWLVVGIGAPERIFLLDRQTGEIMSHHAVGGYKITGLTFDPTSTFIAGIACHDNWGQLFLWKLTSAEYFQSHWEEDQSSGAFPPNLGKGACSLKVEHWELDRTGVAWPKNDLADTIGTTVFSPDGHLVVFRLLSFYNTPFVDFVAYEVPSGKQRWHIRRESDEGFGECFAFPPDGQYVLICGQDNTLSMYRASDGTLQSHFPSGVREPIQALAFDHDGTTLWLASGETVIPYLL
ncbi:MAG TPA: WD40 repeat domain-containing protein [Ktedonobacteraceae bacterium]|nr:WD40 repeat domain-containing protein [Ktedonobacteraceae bacterium]